MERLPPLQTYPSNESANETYGPVHPPESVAILVPCFNTSQTAFEVLHASEPYARTLLAINDGSTDDTAHWLHIAPAEVLSWEKNRGKGHVIVEGMRRLWNMPGWEVMITVDSDGQHSPADIPKLLRKQLQTGADIVVGSRDFRNKGVPSIRRMANRVSSRLIRRLTGLEVPDVQCGLRLFTRSAVQKLLPHLKGGSFEVETDILLLADHLGLTIRDTSIETIYRVESSKRSSWRAIHHSRLILKVCWNHLWVRRRRLPRG